MRTKEEQREYYKKNREHCLVLARMNRLRHRDQYLAANRQRRKDNPLKFKLRDMKKYNGLRENMFHILGHICVRCGQHDKRLLQFDHINGGGLKDIMEKNGYKSRNCGQIYRYYREHPDECKKILQVLCANCNWLKRYTSDEPKNFFSKGSSRTMLEKQSIKVLADYIR